MSVPGWSKTTVASLIKTLHSFQPLWISNFLLMRHYDKPLLVRTSQTRTMEALFTARRCTAKLVLFDHANNFGGPDCRRVLWGFKTWGTLPCGCCLSSPGYIITTERRRLPCALIALMQAAPQWQVPSCCLHFFSISTSHRTRIKEDVLIQLCGTW